MHVGNMHAGDMHEWGPTHGGRYMGPIHGRYMGGVPITDPRALRAPQGVAALAPHCASNLPAHKTVNPVGRTRRGRARVQPMATQQNTSSSARTPATALERA